MKIEFQRYWHEIFVFSVFVLILLTLVRLCNVLFFGDWHDTLQSIGFLNDLFFKGFRFDLKFISSVLLTLIWLPIILISWFIPEKLFSFYIRVIFRIVLLLSILLVFVDAGYIFYFQKPIDVLIFGFIEDDTHAIINMILDNFKILLFFGGFIIISFVVMFLYSKVLTKEKFNPLKVYSQKYQLSLWLISFLILALLSRGSFSSFPLQRKHASVSDNTFLNSMVMNSPFNMYYALRDRSENSQAIFKQDILKINKLDSLQQLIKKAGYSEKNPLLRKTPVNEKLAEIKPHVIFVFMESWSSHIFRFHSNDNNVLGEFAKHAREDYLFTQFLASTYATNPAIESILLNSPITPLSQSIAGKTHFKLSNILPFKKQGYQTLFLSGGNSSWRNHNNFWLLQGFDQYKGRSEIENYFKVDASDNPWGVYDKYVFDYLKKTLQEAEQQDKSVFSAVLTTNNHPPIRLPKSFKRPALKPSVFGFDDDDESKLALLSGFYYQTSQLGEFISWIKSSAFKDKVIVVATGDHPQRTFIDNSAISDKYFRYSVPAYIYVPESLDKLKHVSKDVPASHNDLFPTIFELSLSNASYYNFGQPLTEKKLNKAYGFTFSGNYIFQKGMLDSSNNKFYSWADEHKLVVNSDPQSVADEQMSVLNKEFYRKLLKEYLLVDDYKNRR